MKLISRIKNNPELKKFVIYLITSKRNPKPRLWVKYILNPFFHKRGKNSVIRRRRSRIDVFPWNRFDVGELSTIEDFTTINNGSGDVIIGNRVRIGIGSGSGLAQNVFVSGFNHGYKDGNMNSSVQPLDLKPVEIGEDSHIGANSVVLAGVKIGKRCQIGAGSVVTKNIPDFSVAVGNPAKVIKKYNPELGSWVRVD